MTNEGARVFTRFLPFQVFGDFSRRSRAANSAVESGPNSNLSEILIVRLSLLRKRKTILNPE